MSKACTHVVVVEAKAEAKVSLRSSTVEAKVLLRSNTVHAQCWYWRRCGRGAASHDACLLKLLRAVVHTVPALACQCVGKGAASHITLAF